MPKGILKAVGVVVGLLCGIILIVIASAYITSNARLSRTYTITSKAVPVANDTASIERGQHLVIAITKCTECHGENLAGRIFIDAPPFLVTAPNLTSGAGGIGASYSGADWERAIRHGVRPDGSPLLVMPAEEYFNLNDADVGAIIAYMQSLPAVDNTVPKSQMRLLGRVLMLFGQLPVLPAEAIDHTASASVAPPAGITPEYGRYLAMTGGCMGCHGPGLSGGAIPGMPPDSPAPTNITPKGIGSWSETDFFRALREGKRPDGSMLNAFMPWKNTAKMTDTEIKALLAYLRTVPPKESGGR